MEEARGFNARRRAHDQAARILGWFLIFSGVVICIVTLFSIITFFSPSYESADEEYENTMEIAQRILSDIRRDQIDLDDNNTIFLPGPYESIANPIWEDDFRIVLGPQRDTITCRTKIWKDLPYDTDTTIACIVSHEAEGDKFSRNEDCLCWAFKYRLESRKAPQHQLIGGQSRIPTCQRETNLQTGEGVSLCCGSVGPTALLPYFCSERHYGPHQSGFSRPFVLEPTNTLQKKLSGVRTISNPRGTSISGRYRLYAKSIGSVPPETAQSKSTMTDIQDQMNTASTKNPNSFSNDREEGVNSKVEVEQEMPAQVYDSGAQTAPSGSRLSRKSRDYKVLYIVCGIFVGFCWLGLFVFLMSRYCVRRRRLDTLETMQPAHVQRIIPPRESHTFTDHVIPEAEENVTPKPWYRGIFLGKRATRDPETGSMAPPPAKLRKKWAKVRDEENVDPVVITNPKPRVQVQQPLTTASRREILGKGDPNQVDAAVGTRALSSGSSQIARNEGVTRRVSSGQRSQHAEDGVA